MSAALTCEARGKTAALHKQRNQIECFFGGLKINRTVATQYDQLAESFLSMAHIASAKYRLKFVHAA